jgi:tRNA (guanine37-N1)-methyltransferase
MIQFDILTIFPEMFVSPFDSSLLKKARDRKILQINVHNIRDYATDKHKMTDDYPYGGGSGMIMKVEPMDRALKHIAPDKKGVQVVLLTPQGKKLDQGLVEELARYERIVLICGHYEGVDERVMEHLADREISIGDYILTGGELPAMILVDAVSRLVPGVLGNEGSAGQDSFSAELLEYPQYTRPAEYNGWKVPEVLLSGNHRDIDHWRRREALKRTLDRRPDLFSRASLSDEDSACLQELKREEEE